jgi:chemotaxis protein MotA
MDPLTIAGVVLAFVFILGSMVLEGGNPMSIILIAPMILVFGGTLAAGAAGNYLPEFLASLKSAKDALMAPKPESADSLIGTIEQCTVVARKEGLLRLEETLKTIEDPFLKKGLQLAIDGTDPDEVAEILEAEIRATKRIGGQQSKLFKDLSGYAPTIGIIGTVMGLINVLSHLEDPGELGPHIASAFIATLWGVLSANIMWLPLANKLGRITEVKVERMELIVEGILMIQAGSNPRMVRQKLMSLMPSAADEAKAA